MSIERSRHKDLGPIVIDGISYIPSSVLLTGIPKISFKDNRAFAVVDPQGESPRIYSNNTELGVYYNDTRYLGVWELSLNGEHPVSLANELRFRGNTAVISMTNRDLIKIGTPEGEGSERSPADRIPRDTFLIRRILSFFEDTLYETVDIKNFDSVAHPLQIHQWAGSRFEDVFEVRGFPRSKRGQILTPEEFQEDGKLTSVLSYRGLDGQIRRTYIQRLFQAEGVKDSDALIGSSYSIQVPAKATLTLKTVISFDRPSNLTFHGSVYAGLSTAEKMRLLAESVVKKTTATKSVFSSLTFTTDNAIIERAITNAETDLTMLLTREQGGNLYPYAGIPWFSAPFGRDGIIAAYQLLPWHSSIAKGVLDYVFSTLGTQVDPFTDEQPGKVFHEMRRGEMSHTREVPFIPYYGSVDSTPLALILLHEYLCWTHDREKLQQWWPYALRAMEWIDCWGDFDRDGFVEYAKQSPTGLVNQGWKDSHDSVMHADGVLAKAPIRLCEVQGYAFRARMAMSSLAKYLGHGALSEKFRRDALELKSRFSEEFWDSSGQFIYLALDGESKPCAVRSSNMGHCLWSRILTWEQAERVAQLLCGESMFSGHGIRTLASTERSYNPLSYHNGSIWPHDNSMIMEGFRNYGYTGQLEKLAMALIGVLESSEDFRLPELYCGFRKRGTEPPVPYEVACKPQAWAAGSLFLMLKSILGMNIDLEESYLVFNSPLLTPKINFLEIKNLKGRDWEIDLVFRRARHGTTLEVTRKSGNVRVVTVK